jgi:hypothetical protein
MLGAMTDDPPTPRTTLAASYARVLLSCDVRGHMVEVRVQRASPLGRRLQAGERLPWYCEACGSGCVDLAPAPP